LVFEDDAKVPPNFVENANSIIRNSKLLNDTKEWDLWLLGCKCDDLTPISNDKLIRVESFLLSHAYVITKECAEKFLREAFPIHCHIDMWMSIYGHINNMMYVRSPYLNIPQATVTSDIQLSDENALCNIPTDFYKTHTIVSKMEWNIARATEVMSLILIGYILYREIPKLIK
jgi:GR25 family glycosyltransferase involved in LPS biosynthesis